MQIMSSQLLDRKVLAAMTGPGNGFQAAREWKDKSTTKTLICGTHGEPQFPYSETMQKQLCLSV